MANHKTNWGWVRRILLWTFFLSLFTNSVSQTLIQGMALAGSIAVLMVIIIVGVLFDIIGVAATAAQLPPLNARAAKKVPGARQALNLAMNSDQVASFCNDVVGDICGIVSGAAGAAIVFNLALNSHYNNYVNIITMALVASLTVGGKAAGKAFAIRYSTEILMAAGRFIYFFNALLPGHKNGRRNRK